MATSTLRAQTPAVLYHHFRRPMPYSIMQNLQSRQREIILCGKKAGAQSDVLLLLEHQPVYTLGKRRTEMSDEEVERLRRLGAEIVKTERGGLITFHGPGQLVGYPILDLNGRNEGMPSLGMECQLPTRTYVHLISTFLYDLLRSLPTPVHTIPPSTEDNVGLFVTPTSKIASIGIQLQRRITSHGFALNVSSDVEPWFRNIVACGLEGVSATSISREAGREVRVEDIVPTALTEFERTFGRRMLPLVDNAEEEIVELVRETEQRADVMTSS
ncbi:lipoyltransferase [Atractiella rhizophila]|nr:lipoyltransferase [Atractiella rhizophila]